MDTLFDVSEHPKFGVPDVLAWQSANFPDVWRWTADRQLSPPPPLVADGQLRHRGLAEDTEDSSVDSRFPLAVVDRLTADVVVHPHGASMVADRAPIRLVGVPSLMCPLYVNDTRELFLPGWLDVAALSTLFPLNDTFSSVRPVCLTWLVLDAPVWREPGGDFMTFAYLFTREGTDPGARWHWRANAGRD